MNDPSEHIPDSAVPDTGHVWLSALEAATALGVHERTVRRAIKRGHLPATKRSGTWRIDPADLALLRSTDARKRSRNRPASIPPLVLLPQMTVRPPFEVPQPRIPLIGREQEIDAVRSLILNQRAPLVTLIGPGGSGKTRLSLAIAARLRDRFADGIWFVDVSEFRDPDLVPDAIARALNLQGTAGESTFNRLRDYLRSRITLLVLDNVEQVALVGPAIARLLTECPGLQVLVTSRIPLRVTVEHIFPVAPLELPPLEPQPTPDEVESASATRLFLQAAQRVRPEFRIRDNNAAAVATLCTRLDGLPLAIELAAAQSALYSPAAFLERLDTQFNVLEPGPSDAPPRLRTMRDAIGWSYDLLPETLQIRFRRLCVFAGGFTPGAAAGVTSHPPLNRATLDADLQALVHASLVVADPDMNRFRMLETIRAFGQAKLEDEDNQETLRNYHAQWCLELLSNAWPHWITPTQTAWGDIIEQDHSNLRSALEWLVASERSAELVALVGLAWPFWFVRHHRQEGRAWLEVALDASAFQRTLERVRILVGAGCLWLMQGYEPAARAFNEEALVLSQKVGGTSSIDSPLNGLAICANVRGDFDEGLRFNQEALAVLRAQPEDVAQAVPMTSVILNNMAYTLFAQGEVDESERLAREALALQRKLGFDWAAADTLHLCARIAEAKGQFNHASTCYRESLHLSRNARSPDRAEYHRPVCNVLRHGWRVPADCAVLGNQRSSP